MIMKQNTPHIVIDARTTMTTSAHYVSQRTSEFVNQLIESNPQELRFTVLVPAGITNLAKPLSPQISLLPVRKRWFSILGQVELALVLWKQRPNLFYSPDFVLSMLTNTPFATSITDLIYAKISHPHKIWQRMFFLFLFAWKIRKAKAIVTFSSFSKNEIMKYFEVSEDLVKVIYGSIGRNFKRPIGLTETEKSAFRSKYKLPEKYILSAEHRRECKNISRLVEAWSLGDFQEDLVLLTEFDPGILSIAERRNRGHRIFFIRSVPNEDLPMLYSLAKMFVHTSLNDSSSISPLEAAACEVPLVASKISALPELLGDAAIYIDPTSVKDIARGLRECLNSPQEQLQYHLTKGREQAQKLSLEKMTKESLSLCREICQ